MRAKIKRGKMFRGLFLYARDQGPRATGKKGGRLLGGNVDLSLSCQEQAKVFQDIARRRPDVERPVLHISLALPPGDHLSDDNWNDVGMRFLDEMGIDVNLHQFAIIRHEDTAHEHVHIIVNRVSVSGSLWLGQWEMKRAMAATTKLEIEFGLTLTTAFDPKNPVKRKSPKSGAIGVMRRTGKIPVSLKLQDRIEMARNQSTTFASFVKALFGLDVRLLPAGKTGQVPGVLFESDGVIVKGSSLGNSYAWRAISGAVNFDPIIDAPLIAKLRSQGFVEPPVANLRAEKLEPQLVPKRRLVCAVVPVGESEHARQQMQRRLLEQHYQSVISTQLIHLLAGDGLHRLPKSLLLTLNPQGRITDYGGRITAGLGNAIEISALVQLIGIKKWRRVRLTGNYDFIMQSALALMRAGKARADIQAHGLSGHESVERAWEVFTLEQAPLKKLKQKKEISNGNDRQRTDQSTTGGDGTRLRLGARRGHDAAGVLKSSRDTERPASDCATVKSEIDAKSSKVFALITPPANKQLLQKMS